MQRPPVLRVTYSTDTDPDTSQTAVARESGTENRQRWRWANQARLKQGHRKAVAMLAMKLSRFRGREIASAFETTPGAVYVRLHRLRRGFYCRGVSRAQTRPFNGSTGREPTECEKKLGRDCTN